MIDLAHESFAKHGDRFFLEESGGVLIVSEALLKKEHVDIQKKRWFLFSRIQEVLEVAKQRVFDDIKQKELERHGEVSALLTQLQTPARFSPTHDLPSEAVLLTNQTTVTLSNIEISERLFFVLLGKTKITVGENFSITEHIDNEDCIREHSMARNSPVWLGRNEAVSRLALENIERMPPSSIGCVLGRFSLYNTDLINIVPKLRIHEAHGVGFLWLYTERKEHVAGILKDDQMFCVGGTETIWLGGYAVGVITKTRIREDCEVEKLILYTKEKEHVAVVLGQEKPFCVGRVKKMFFRDYAVCVITKIRAHKDCEFESLWLAASKEDHVAAVLEQEEMFFVGRVGRMELQEHAVCAITKRSHKDCVVECLRLHANRKEYAAAVLGHDKPFCVGRVKILELYEYAVGSLPQLTIHEDCVVERLELSAKRNQYVAAVLERGKEISIERVRNIWLWDYAVSILPQLKIHGDGEVESLSLHASGKENVAAVLEHEREFCVGRVKNMSLRGYAVCVVTKMRIHEDNTMESFVLDGRRKHFSGILEEGDSSIELGRIRRRGFKVPREIRQKLRYTLVDGGGKEVGEENIFLRNKTAMLVLFLAICFSSYRWL
ncbi:MAG: uncharacterized protein A8A55_1483 [Amphiamblys sp. WSBS2006]|nr:MAG: uncharacterized protein A8A55_1483 [Amphiamblys sp. WSBS2006]